MCGRQSGAVEPLISQQLCSRYLRWVCPYVSEALICINPAQISLGWAAFLVHEAPQSDFGRSGRCVPNGRFIFGSSYNPACSADRSVCGTSATRLIHYYEECDAEGQRSM